MGPIPIQRANDPDGARGARPGAGSPPPFVRISLESDPVAPAEARRLVRAALAEWTGAGLLGGCAFCGLTEGPGGGAALPACTEGEPGTAHNSGAPVAPGATDAAETAGPGGVREAGPPRQRA
ncbi:hypothetical protein L1885_17350, partial [Streptomyces fuscigenes]|nr:hypothetical protein [Streptomyces fuscigenes]